MDKKNFIKFFAPFMNIQNWIIGDVSLSIYIVVATLFVPQFHLYSNLITIIEVCQLILFTNIQ